MRNYIIRIFDMIRNLFKKEARIKIRPAADKDYEYNLKRAQNREELDRLLDKINRYGEKSLTKSERDFLKNTYEF